MIPGHFPLFDPAWLSIPPDALQDDILHRIAEAERRAGEALVRLTAAVGNGSDDLDGWIDALLALETRAIPEDARAAAAAVERVTVEVGFRRRALLPRFRALDDRIRAVHRQALVACRDARWASMARRAQADPGGPSSPLQGGGTRYVKSDRYDARAARSLSPIDRVRADRKLKRLGESPVPPQLGLRAAGDSGNALWIMTAGHPNRFILRRGEAAGVPCFVVEDVGPHADYDEWGARC